jgi:hypothetical protein
MTAFFTWQYRNRAVPLAKIERLRRLAWLIDAVGRVPHPVPLWPEQRHRIGTWCRRRRGDSDLALYRVRSGAPRAAALQDFPDAAECRRRGPLGAFPLLGDLLDLVRNANLRNVAIIDEHFGMMSRQSMIPTA